MINDRTIDEKTAQYWCAFANKNFKKSLDQIILNIANSKVQNVAQNTIENNIKDDDLLDESFADFMTPSDPAGGSVGIVGDLAGKTPEQIKATAEGMATAAGVAVTTLTPVGKIALQHPKTSLLTIAAAKLGMDAVGDEDDSWIEKLKKLVNKVWDIGKFTAKHGKLFAAIGTTAFALFKTAPFWMPMLASTVKSILRGNSLAIVKFNSNDIWYKMHYDIKYKKWELIYKGMSLSEPSPEETDQLMNTQFFNNFLNQCKRYIDPILNNENREAVLQAISNLADKKTQNILNMILNDKDIIDNMFAMKFKY